MKTFDTRIKQPFMVDVAHHPQRYKAQYFWPDVKPWPEGIFQISREGELNQVYLIKDEFGYVQQVEAGALFLYSQDSPLTPKGVLTKEQLNNGSWLVVTVNETQGIKVSDHERLKTSLSTLLNKDNTPNEK